MVRFKLSIFRMISFWSSGLKVYIGWWRMNWLKRTELRSRRPKRWKCWRMGLWAIGCVNISIVWYGWTWTIRLDWQSEGRWFFLRLVYEYNRYVYPFCIVFFYILYCRKVSWFLHGSFNITVIAGLFIIFSVHVVIVSSIIVWLVTRKYLEYSDRYKMFCLKINY